MKLYHGTNLRFENIDLAKSKPNKDFGQGFYLSDNYEQALELAKSRVALVGGQAIVLEYLFDENILTSDDLKILRFADYSEEWAKFILLNRNNPTATSAHDYDIVIGPIANDRVGAQLWKYNNHTIDMPTLVKNLRFMKGITIQYYFGTKRAIEKLKRL